MFRFANIEFLWLLVLVPIVWIIHLTVNRWRTKTLQSLGDSFLVEKIIPNRSKLKQNIKVVLFSLALIFIILGIANPQIGSKLEEVKREGIDIMICLDLSNSMNAEDLSPSRLKRSKRAIQKFIDQLKSDRIGIIVFGGQAYVQLPITTDYAAAKLFLSSIDTEIIPTQGTAIGAAIELAIESFDHKSPTQKSIIIITDGENHEDDAVEEANNAQELGITVHTVGVGSTEGAPIPLYRGTKQIGFRKDNEGNTIVTKINEEMLKEIADEGEGIYVHATNANSGLSYILDNLNSLEKTEFGTSIYTDYEDRFQYFIGFGFLLLLIDIFILERKSTWLDSSKLFKTKE